jgi:hypothetical protein
VAIIIAGIGAGVAAAMALIGVSLPIFSEGLDKLSKIDAAGLGSVALGVGKLGLGLVAFAPFALFGLPAAFALNMLADGVVKLNSVDPGKLERVAAAMQKVKDAAPSIGESIAAGIGGLVSKVIGPSEAPATESKSAAAGATSNTNNIEAELKRLNTVSEELLKYIKEIADHSKQNVSATKSLNGDLFSF